jgi:hypothetical protein
MVETKQTPNNHPFTAQAAQLWATTPRNDNIPNRYQETKSVWKSNKLKSQDSLSTETKRSHRQV